MQPRSVGTLPRADGPRLARSVTLGFIGCTLLHKRRFVRHEQRVGVFLPGRDGRARSARRFPLGIYRRWDSPILRVLAFRFEKSLGDAQFIRGR